jgi:hypothetical protein
MRYISNGQGGTRLGGDFFFLSLMLRSWNDQRMSLMESVDSCACGFRECRPKVPETRHKASHGAEDASQ